MNTPGFDFETGYGFVNSYLAVLVAKREGETMMKSKKSKKEKQSKNMKDDMFGRISRKDKRSYCEYTESPDTESQSDITTLTLTLTPTKSKSDKKENRRGLRK